MKNAAHLTQEEMVQAIDGELTSSGQAEIEIHLANCEQCLNQYERLAELSETLRHVVDTASVSVPVAARQRLADSMESSKGHVRVQPPVLWKWAAVAAGLAILLLLIVQQRPRSVQNNVTRKPALPSASRDASEAARRLPSEAQSPHSPRRRPAQAARRDGASSSPIEGAFIRLPYSDPSLPIQTSDVVRVEMRLSSLANAGVIRAAPGLGDPLVRADVLLGLDGQPSAIRLVQTVGARR
jgi:anti-sigma factor RsiW